MSRWPAVRRIDKAGAGSYLSGERLSLHDYGGFWLAGSA